MMHMLQRTLTAMLVGLFLASTLHAEVQFDGVDDYIDIGTASVYRFENMSFTAVGWFKATVDGYLIAKRVIGGSGWFVRLDSGGTATARLLGAALTTAQRISASTTLLNGAWHHFAAVFTTDTVTTGNNTISLYIDGVLDQGALTNNDAPYVGTDDALRLGVVSDLSGSFLTGSLDDIRIYPVALNAEQVDRLSKARLRYSGPHLAGTSYWPLDDCAAGASGEGVVFRDRWRGGSDGTGVDGDNNTGLTCQGTTRLSYPEGVE